VSARPTIAASLRAEAAWMDAEAAVGHARAARLWTVRQAAMARVVERRAIGCAEDSMRLKLRAAELEARFDLRRTAMETGAVSPRRVTGAQASSPLR